MKIKVGGEHHIATDHGPMVQEELLTGHPGSIHDGEETPGGQSCLWQGAGKRSAGAPGLGSAAAAEQRRDSEKGFYLRRIYRRRGQPRGPPGVWAPPWRGPTLGRATRAHGPLVVALWPHLGDSGRFW